MTHTVSTGKDRVRYNQVGALGLKNVVIIISGSQWPRGGLGGARQWKSPLMDGKSLWGRKICGFTLLVWPLGHRPGLPFSQDGVSTLSESLGGSGRVLRGGREEMLPWLSLIIRPVNCNYFCN